MALQRLDLGIQDVPVTELCELARARDFERDLIDEQVARAVEQACASGVRWSTIAAALRGA